jgi:peptidoglycan/LPS O-acetylase OafA/YrhL
MGTTIRQSGAALPALTSIRFCAALTVVLAHFTALGLLALPPAWIAALDGGRPAVSLFFVLSGFILALTYRDALAQGGARRYYAARFARIYPVLLLSLVLALAVTLYLVRTDDGTLLHAWYALKRADYLALAASLLCQVLLLTAWLPFAALNQPWNGPAWSLSCEAFFYTVFPWLLKQIAPLRMRTLALLCLGLWLSQGLWLWGAQHLLSTARSGFVIAQFPLSHLFEFVLGICAASAFATLRDAGRRTHRLGLRLVSMALAVLAVLVAVNYAHGLPQPVYFIAAPWFGALILGLALLERPVLGLLEQRWLVRLGEASYSLYLIHVPLAHLAYLAGVRSGHGGLALLGTIGCSALVFRYFEEPLRKRIRARLSRAPAAGAAELDPLAPRLPV